MRPFWALKNFESTPKIQGSCSVAEIGSRFKISLFYDGCPPPFDVTKKFKIPSAQKVTRSKPGRKIASLGKLQAELGWQYAGVVERLEAKRHANALTWYNKRQEANAKRAAAIASVDAKVSPINQQLAALGH